MNLRAPRLLALGVPALLLGQCGPDRCAPVGPAAPVPSYTVTHVVDGDTVDVSGADGSAFRVRLIGIDAPEAGMCGAAEATATLRGLVDGQTVALTVGARDDVDSYGRRLRYVETATTDAGLTLVEQGSAIARYDSRDGYGGHTREAAYVAADAATPSAGCVAPAPAPSAPAPGGVHYANCDAVWAAGAAPLYAGQPGYETPRLDRDGDGIACE